MLNNLQKMHLKLLQKEFQKTVEVTCNSIGNKIADRITKVSQTSLNSAEKVKNQHDKEIPKKGHISLEER